VITAKEILADEDQHSEIDAEGRDAGIRVKTAVSWLERARLLEREEYYHERNFQIHVMQEYARLGLEKLGDAMAFIAVYFRWSKTEFIKRYFATRRELLELATTGESLHRIVDDLKHPLQQFLVSDKTDSNHLILAGPGSGKTRVIVHRVSPVMKSW